jgi:ABC-2 type transport system ATP-binding protein
MNQTAIRTHNLSRNFGSLRAVDGINIEVPRGIVYGFLGPNGSGKTTTIRLLLGLLEPTEGGAEVLGFDTLTQGDAIRRNSGALLEHTGLYERLSAEDNLNFYGRIWHIPARERHERIRQLLSDLDLYDRRDENVANWSRGMKQKLAVARTLLHNPELVFLDEPTAGLDPVAAAALREDLANLVRQHGVTVFLTTHNLTEAEKLCNRVGVIRSGKLIADGSPDELRIRQNRNQVEVIGSGFNEMLLAALRQRADVTGALIENQHLVIDLAQGANSSDLMPLLIAHKVQIDEVRKGKASLEEAFLDLMEEEQSE